MLFFDIIFIFILAILISVLFTGGMGWRHPRSENAAGSLLFFFAVLFFAMWAAGSWLPVWGPVLWGIPWLSFLLIACLVTLLLFAVSPVEKKPKTTQQITEAEAAAGVIFGLFFWLLIPVLLIIALLAYA